MALPKLLVICHTNLGNSLSGGDRIFLNLIKYWQPFFDITVLASPEANRLITRNKLKVETLITTSLPTVTSLSTINLFLHHLQRFITGTIFCLTHAKLFSQYQYVYTSSDFYGDFTFGLMSKIFSPKIKWLCGYYLLAPSPLDPSSPYRTNKHPIRGLIYYLAQIPTVFLAKRLADMMFVTSTPDIKIFQNHRLPTSKIMIVQGGVHIPSPTSLSKMKPVSKRKFDAFYLGRLHNQKGVIEMIDIWAKVVHKLPKAKLVIVGDGELMGPMTDKIKKLSLSANTKVIGFLVGSQKFKLIKNSRIVLHPATYDSGGMAAAEAMAWGLPGVSFDLPALKTYYPKGMVKVPPIDIDKFASTVVKLLTDSKFYQKHSRDARQLTIESWNWQTRFENIYQQVRKL